MVDDKIIVIHKRGNIGMRRKLGKLMLVAVVGVIFVALSTAGFATEAVRYDGHAEVLKGLDLFSGSNKGFELERAPKRVEVAAMLVKFLVWVPVT